MCVRRKKRLFLFFITPPSSPADVERGPKVVAGRLYIWQRIDNRRNLCFWNGEEFNWVALLFHLRISARDWLLSPQKKLYTQGIDKPDVRRVIHYGAPRENAWFFFPNCFHYVWCSESEEFHSSAVDFLKQKIDVHRIHRWMTCNVDLIRSNR